MSDYWTKTGECFSKIIDKPKMSEKLLKKPPPKYIYDIVMNTMKKTKFPEGLFTEEELDIKYFEKDPRHKAEIIQKVIDITKIVINENFDIKVTKILKGEEPEKTNYFLRSFYEAATKSGDKSKYIEKYLAHKSKKEEPQEKKGGSAMPDNYGKKNKEESNTGGEPIKMSNIMKIDKNIFKHEQTEEQSETKKIKSSNIDLESIKKCVENISKTSNPLGKLIDLLGEDIESMNKELQGWIRENKGYKEKFEEEVKKSDETLLPLQNELLELEDSIRDEQMQIKSIKSRLIKNEKIIQNLITNVISFKSEGN